MQKAYILYIKNYRDHLKKHGTSRDLSGGPVAEVVELPV